MAAVRFAYRMVCGRKYHAGGYQRRRKDAGLSRQKLSLMAGLPKKAILRIEAGRASYTYPIRARAISEALNCQIGDIFDEVKGA